MNRTKYLYLFKIIIIGDSVVGKSSMLYRFRNGHYPERFSLTDGVELSFHILEVEPGVRVKLQIFDTTGNEAYWRYQLVQHIFPYSAGCLLVFDLGNRESFSFIKHQYKKVYDSVNPYTVLFIIVGHKCDIKEQEVNQEAVEQFASELGAPYIEASAKTGHNVAEAFELLTRRIYQGYLSGDVRLHEKWGNIQENKTNKDEPTENSKCSIS
ncbi:ras-related protein Rab-39A-like [Garra rufa]|uniref:ras-related protein Rab-39A-like n=1 Tax=Garra rufa TaxID=137080 RepID=UPI003CCE65A8